MLSIFVLPSVLNFNLFFLCFFLFAFCSFPGDSSSWVSSSSSIIIIDKFAFSYFCDRFAFRFLLFIESKFWFVIHSNCNFLMTLFNCSLCSIFKLSKSSTFTITAFSNSVSCLSQFSNFCGLSS